MFSFRRPLPEWRVLRTRIRDALSLFLVAPSDNVWRIPVTESFDLPLIRATDAHDKPFLLGVADASETRLMGIFPDAALLKL